MRGKTACPHSMSDSEEDVTIIESGARADASEDGDTLYRVSEVDSDDEEEENESDAEEEENESDEDEDEEEDESDEDEEENESNGTESEGIDDDESAAGSTDSFFKIRMGLEEASGRSSARRFGNGDKKKVQKRKLEHSERSKRLNRRRKIADVISDDDLDVSTRRAREAEAKRAQKIDAILGNFSTLSEEQLAVPVEEKETYVCLNPVTSDGAPPTGDEGSDDAPIFVYKDLVEKLKPHQIIGARFLWSHIAVEPDGFGCVLADFMGMGKTLQVITTVQAFLSKQIKDEDGDLTPRYQHVLILAPTICVRNWEAEVVKWLGKKETRRLGLFTLESSREKKMTDRVYVVKKWHKRGGILVMGYELYRLLVLQSTGQEKIGKSNKKHAHSIKQMYACLSDPGPDLIVLDEGHRVRNHKSKMVKALAHVKTKRRIILTGYPLQNHLEEYWTMVNFARPNYLGSLEEFKNRYVAPITNGQCIDSSEADLRLARHRAFVLTRELKPFVLRRDQQYLFKQLPPKKEYVIMCKLTDAQAQLYRSFLQHGVPTRGYTSQVDVLGGYHIALAISNHPDVIYETYKQLENEEHKSKISKRNGVTDIFADEDSSDDLEPEKDFLSSRVTSHVTNGNADKAQFLNDRTEPEPTPNKGSHRLKFAQEFMEKYVPNRLESSGKMIILMELLQACQGVSDRVIIFSQSIPTLDIIEVAISKHNKYQRRRAKRINYLRIDGSTSQQDRFRQIAQFNDLEEDVDVIMISTKAGGEGINLCAGNRIIIFDVCWNPCNDSQSMCRSYRFGQTKPVFVYRFVTMGTMEKKVYDLQIRKEGVAKRIVDEKTTERKFMSSELQKYFSIEDFEDSLLHAQGKVVDGKEAETQALPHEDPVLENILTEMHGTSASVSKEDGNNTTDNMATETKWIIAWFEQETMFEEDLDQQCTPDEQKELLETYRYFKAVQRLRSDGSHQSISREGVLCKNCDFCRAPNEIYPIAITSVPVPSKIECIFCKRSIPTAGAAPFVQNPVAYYPLMQQFVPVLMPTTNALPFSVALPAGAATSAHSFAPNGSRVLPPHLQTIHRGNSNSNDQQHAEQQQLLLQRKQTEEEEVKRKQERLTMKLSDRHLLILRRGIKKCQDLKRQAEECGATLAIEVDTQLTDIVSSMNLAETLQWLKLKKLPHDVDLHDDVWLWNEIAKEKGQPRVQAQPSLSVERELQVAKGAAIASDSEASIATHPASTSRHTNNESPRTVVESSSTDYIELLDSDNENPPSRIDDNTSAPSGANGIDYNTVVVDGNNVIEIL